MSRGLRRRNAQRLPHVRAALHYLKVCGGEDVVIKHGPAIRLSWLYVPDRGDPRKMSITLTGTSGKAEHGASLACQAIRRCFRQVDVEIGA